jgi:uncharacterized protein YdaU (DUF1376 family)
VTDNKDPSYPWYPRDFAADEPVQLMTLAAEGAYRRLLDHQWLHGSVPGELTQMARICKNITVREMQKIWPSIEGCFTRMEGQPPRLQNRRMERVRTERQEFREKQSANGKRGAEARWHQSPDGSDPNGGGNGGGMPTPLATPMARNSSALALASASARKTSPVSTGEPTSWPGEFAKMYEPVGLIPPPRIGKRLKPVVTHYGIERTREMWAFYIRHAPYTRHGNLDPSRRDTTWMSPEDFVRNAGTWYAKTQPLGGASAATAS